MEGLDKLSPPKRANTGDAGARDLESDSDEHFSDAQSGPSSPADSPIPRIRVEKVSSQPSYGEVPGTVAYELRVSDAEPDEIAIIPDQKLQSTVESGVRQAGQVNVSPEPDAEGTQIERQSTLPGGHPIPLTVLEEPLGDADKVHVEVGGSRPGSGRSSPRSEALERKRRADAPPDLVLRSDGGIEASRDLIVGLNQSHQSAATNAESIGDTPISTTSVTANLALMPTSSLTPSPSSSHVPQHILFDPDTNEEGPNGSDTVDGKTEGTGSPVAHTSVVHSPVISAADVDSELAPDEVDAPDGFVDDFDDFEEGGQDADFDDFGDGFEQSDQVKKSIAAEVTLPFAVPDFDGLEPDEIFNLARPYLAAIFPPDPDLPDFPPLDKEHSIFLTPRSASLWSQLVAPPPLAPPDWIRSRIRRLFLVSLGVPVDLDEILPASKQKKLVLPSPYLPVGGALRRSYGDQDADGDGAGGGPARAGSGSRRRRGVPPQPEFDLVSARQLCTTTEEALGGMTDTELREHLRRLEEMEARSKEVLKYWQARTDEKIGDRDAFEGVIENLVKHARKVRM